LQFHHIKSRWEIQACWELPCGEVFEEFAAQVEDIDRCIFLGGLDNEHAAGGEGAAEAVRDQGWAFFLPSTGEPFQM